MDYGLMMNHLIKILVIIFLLIGMIVAIVIYYTGCGSSIDFEYEKDTILDKIKRLFR